MNLFNAYLSSGKTKFIVAFVCFTTIIMTLSIAISSIHGHQYEAANIRAEAAKIKAKNEYEKEREAAKLTRLKQEANEIRMLVEQGSNPIAAKCAITKWVTQFQRDVCLQAARDNQ